MPSIKIVTDSTGDLPKEIADDLGITVVPLKVILGEEEYFDGVDLTSAQFYSKLKTSAHHPTTSQPSPDQFATVYKNLLKEGADGIVSIHISSELSGTVQSAKIAKDMLSNQPIEVIDTKVTSMALGLIAIEAAHAANTGATLEQVVDIVRNAMNKIKVYFVVDTLEYLKKGGRIGKASAFLGTLLNIKPFLTLENGLVAPVEKIRGKNKALQKLIDKMRDELGKNRKIRASVFHANDIQIATKLAEDIRSQFDTKEIIIADLGAVIGTYVGPGTFGVTYFQI